MIKLNKDSNSPKMERASAPGIKVKKYNIKGIITIEAALAIPLFLFAVICLIYLIEVRNVPYTGLGNMRNESGGRYHACERCVIGTTMTGIYITQYGDRYHNSLNCSGLKRTIRTIKKSQTAGKRGCSKCASE